MVLKERFLGGGGGIKQEKIVKLKMGEQLLILNMLILIMIIRNFWDIYVYIYIECPMGWQGTAATVPPNLRHPQRLSLPPPRHCRLPIHWIRVRGIQSERARERSEVDP
jgi:hypothetical protein